MSFWWVAEVLYVGWLTTTNRRRIGRTSNKCRKPSSPLSCVDRYTGYRRVWVDGMGKYIDVNIYRSTFRSNFVKQINSANISDGMFLGQ